MNDAKFQEGDQVHQLGAAVFVFAGGTRRTLRSFYPHPPSEEGTQAKLPDFVSRLQGHLDVLGPNRSTLLSSDELFPLRRALVLRHQLEEHADRVTQIDASVRSAFLSIDEYWHGARSIQAIVRMSTLAGKARFTAACLPTETQLQTHVDGRRFLEIARSGSL